MNRDTKRLHNLKGSRLLEVNRPPKRSDGRNGEMRMYQRDLYIKTKGDWIKLMSGDKVIQQELLNNTTVEQIFSLGAATHSGLSGVGENDHHNRQHSLNSSDDHTGQLSIANGGTGTNTAAAAAAAFLDVAQTGNALNIGDGSSTITIPGNLTVTSNFTVNGTTTTINSTTLQIDDKHIELAHSPDDAEGDDAAIDGGGIILKSSDSDKSIVWTNSTDSWDFNQGITVGSTLYVDRASYTGKVGIGTATPKNTLHVDGPISIKTSSSSGSFLAFNQYYSSGFKAIEQGDSGRIKVETDGRMAFYTADAEYAADGAITEHENLTLDRGGNVGIGTSSPDFPLDIVAGDSNDLQYGLRIKNENTTNDSAAAIGLGAADSETYCKMAIAGVKKDGNLRGDIQFLLDNTADTSNATLADAKMTIMRTGNVGIGTTAPITNLHIMQVDTGCQMTLHRADTSMASGHELGSLKFMGSHADGTTNQQIGAKIGAFTTENWAVDPANDFGTELRFFTADNVDSAIAQRMVIDEDGNVGIGNTSPAKQLDIAKSTGGELALSAGTTNITITDGTDLGHIYFYGYDATHSATRQLGAMIRAEAADAWDTDDYEQSPAELQFFTQDNSTNTTVSSPRMVIDADGNVGIGEAAPDTALEVTTNTTQLKLSHSNGVDTTFGTDSSGFLYITPSGNNIRVPDALTDFRNHGYTSGIFVGDGWDLYKDGNNDYNLELDNLWVRGSMYVWELVINQIRATNGSLVVTSAAKCSSAAFTTGRLSTVDTITQLGTYNNGEYNLPVEYLSSGDGTGATATVTISSGTIDTITFTSSTGGFDYEEDEALKVCNDVDGQVIGGTVDPVFAANAILTGDINTDTYLTTGDYIELTFESGSEDSIDYHPFADDDLILAHDSNFSDGGGAAVEIREIRLKVIDHNFAGSGGKNKCRCIVEAGTTASTTVGKLEGMAFVRVGSTSDANRQGGVYLTSDDSRAPYIDIWNDVNSFNAWEGVGGFATATHSTAAPGHTVGTHTAVALATITGTGSGAIATVVVGGDTNIESVTITNPGSGYMVGDITHISGSAGTPAVGGGLEAAIVATTANVEKVKTRIGRIDGITGKTNDYGMVAGANASGTLSKSIVVGSESGLKIYDTDKRFIEATGSAIEFYDDISSVATRKLGIGAGDIKMYADDGNIVVSHWNDQGLNFGANLTSATDVDAINISSAGVKIYGNVNTNFVNIDSNAVTMQSSTEDMVTISASGITLRENNVDQITMASNVITVGTSTDQVEINGTSGITIRENDADTIQLINGVITVGSSTDQVEINGTSGITIRENDADVIQLVNGVITVGSSTDQVEINGTSGITIRENNVDTITLVDGTITLQTGGSQHEKLVLTDNSITMSTAGADVFNVTGDIVTIGTDANTKIVIDATDASASNAATFKMGKLSADSSGNITIADMLITGSIFSTTATANVRYGGGWSTTPSGENIIQIGYESGKILNTGNDNICIGRQALEANVLGPRNICIGVSAGDSIVGDPSADPKEGQDNIIIGNYAGSQLTTGANNIIIGNYMRSLDGSGSAVNDMFAIPADSEDSTYIGGTRTFLRRAQIGESVENASYDSEDYVLDVYDDNANDYAMRIWSDGGGSSDAGLEIWAGQDSPSSDGHCLWLNLADGNGDAIAYIRYDHSETSAEIVSASDERMKENIVDTSVNGLDAINSLKFRAFNWIENANRGLTTIPIGLVAQEVAETGDKCSIVKDFEAARELADGTILEDVKGIGGLGMIIYMAKAIQELSAKVTALEAQIN